MPKRHTSSDRKKDALSGMLEEKVVLYVTDGSHLIEEADGVLVGVEEFGVTLHKKYRNQMRVTFYPWHAINKIVPEPL
jgi:hypothetical protein